MIKAALKTVAANDVLYSALDRTVLRPFHTVVRLRSDIERQRRTQPDSIAAALEQLAPNRTVRAGLFAGLQFPDIAGSFAAVPPMLLGTYERDVTETLERLVRTRGYDLIVDVGCAEGYYAVGLARLTKTRVIAADKDPNAREFCGRMAHLNGVKVDIKGTVGPAGLRDMVEDARRALILSDCEGYEAWLFANGSGLERHDLVIECHDWLSGDYEFLNDAPISVALTAALTETHAIDTIQGFDNDAIVRRCLDLCPDLRPYPWPVRKALISEHRNFYAGHWLVCEAR